MNWIAATVVTLALTACGTSTKAPDEDSTPTSEPEPSSSEQTSTEPTNDPSVPPTESASETSTEPTSSMPDPFDPPPVGSEAKGAISIEISPGCSVTDGVYDFPPGSMRPVDGESKSSGWSTGDVATDDSMVTATCTWFDAQPTRVSISFAHGRFGSETQVGVSFEADPGATEASILVSLATPDFSGGLGSMENAGCRAAFIDFDSATKSVWASFTCDALTAYTEGDTCAVGMSYFYFDNCGG